MNDHKEGKKNTNTPSKNSTTKTKTKSNNEKKQQTMKLIKRIKTNKQKQTPMQHNYKEKNTARW